MNLAVQRHQASTLASKDWKQEYFSPLHRNVIFASTYYGMCFSLETFALFYREKQKFVMGLEKNARIHGAQTRLEEQLISVEKFAKFLWGDIYYNIDTRKFQKKWQFTKAGETPRSFVHFVLEPLYKIFTSTLTADKDNLLRILKLELGGISN